VRACGILVIIILTLIIMSLNGTLNQPYFNIGMIVHMLHTSKFVWPFTVPALSGFVTEATGSQVQDDRLITLNFDIGAKINSVLRQVKGFLNKILFIVEKQKNSIEVWYDFLNSFLHVINDIGVSFYMYMKNRY